MAIQAVHHGKKASSMLQNALPQTVDASQLRQYYRAPRGYVIVHDQATGQTIGVRKQDARQLGLWQPKPKPPISVKDWHAYKSAMRTEKKIKKVFKHSFAKHHARSSSACAPVHHRKPKAC
jgi:D-hexose-6-phosphate mutarotase